MLEAIRGFVSRVFSIRVVVKVCALAFECKPWKRVHPRLFFAIVYFIANNIYLIQLKIHFHMILRSFRSIICIKRNFAFQLKISREFRVYIFCFKKLPGTISSGSRGCVFIETESTKRPKNYAFLCVKTSCLHFQDAFSFPFACEASFCVTQTTCFSFAFRNYISPFLVFFSSIYLLSILL
jgi:hypothetical protein